MIAKEGLNIIGAFLIITLVILFIPQARIFSLIPLILFLFSLYFFRSPKRIPPEDPDGFISPADGRVIEITESEDTVKIAIFMSLFDVHVNRIPYDGEVVSVRRIEGKFLEAFKKEAEEKNSRVITRIKSDFGEYEVIQIAGIIARRIVNRLKPGQKVKRGEIMGIIRFGSRVCVIIPKDKFDIKVKEGDRVKAGETILARLKK